MARLRIALLEDDPPLRDVLADVVAELDPSIELVSCSTHRELLNVLADGSIDGVIADAWGQSHAVLTDDDRQAIVGLGRRLPLVLLTGRSWSTQADPADLSAVALIQKPFELEALADAVKRLAARAGQSSGGAESDDAAPPG